MSTTLWLTRSTDSKSTHPSLSFDHLVVRPVPWFSPLSYFRICFVGSIDLSMSTTLWLTRSTDSKSTHPSLFWPFCEAGALAHSLSYLGSALLDPLICQCRTQEVWSQEAFRQEARTQEVRTQEARTQEARTQEVRSQVSREQVVRVQVTRGRVAMGQVVSSQVTLGAIWLRPKWLGSKWLRAKIRSKCLGATSLGTKYLFDWVRLLDRMLVEVTRNSLDPNAFRQTSFGSKLWRHHLAPEMAWPEVECPNLKSLSLGRGTSDTGKAFEKAAPLKCPPWSKCFKTSFLWPGNTKRGSITVLLTSCLTVLEAAVWQLTIFVFIYKTG